MRMYGPIKKQKLRAFATTLTLKKKPPLKKPCAVLTLELKYSSGSGKSGSVLSLHGSSDGGLRVALSKAHNVMTMRRREQARLALQRWKIVLWLKINLKALRNLKGFVDAKWVLEEVSD